MEHLEEDYELGDNLDLGDRSSIERKSPLPPLNELHKRHPGVSYSVCQAHAEAASVCLSRHHTPPTDFQVSNEGRISVREINWSPPEDRAKRAWNNTDDATEAGAYAVSLAAVEVELGLVAVERADVPTGADYYLAQAARAQDLEEDYRLEVSGLDRGELSDVRRRLQEKVAQTRRGDSNIPAIACVVGFRQKLVSIERVV